MSLRILLSWTMYSERCNSRKLFNPLLPYEFGSASTSLHLYVKILYCSNFMDSLKNKIVCVYETPTNVDLKNQPMPFWHPIIHLWVHDHMAWCPLAINTVGSSPFLPNGPRVSKSLIDHSTWGPGTRGFTWHTYTTNCMNHVSYNYTHKSLL